MLASRYIQIGFALLISVVLGGDASAQPDPGERALADYRQGKRLLKTPYANVVWEYVPTLSCTRLPLKRPADLSITYYRRSGGHHLKLKHRNYGLTDKAPCRIQRNRLHLPAVPSSCRVVSPRTMDALWRVMRDNHFSKIRSRFQRVSRPTDAAGDVLTVRWKGARCSVEAITPHSKVLKRWLRGYTTAVKAFTSTYNAATPSR